MKVTANLATHPPRHQSLKKMINSLTSQFDEVRICLNEYDKAPEFLRHPKIKVWIPKKDLTDNGKFAFLQDADKDEIYCTVDDDLIYPADYRSKIEEAISNYPDDVITFHGRKLKGIFNNYYKAPHKVFRFSGDVKEDSIIDVPGTGVTAFKADIRLFKGAESGYKCMSDIILGLYCAQKNKTVRVINHKRNWIKHIDNKDSIFSNNIQFDKIQAILCQKILEFKQ